MQTLKKKIILLFLLVFFSISFIAIASNVEATSNNNIVKVAWPAKESFEGEKVLSTKMSYGFDKDYYEKLSEVTGLDFEYTNATFDESLTMLASGEVDVVAGVAYTPTRAKRYTYIMSPMSFSTVSFLEKDNSKKYYYEETENLNYKTPANFLGKKIGVEERYKSYYFELLKNKKIDPNKLNIVSYSNYGVMKKDLLASKLDYIISFTTLSDIDGLKETMRLKTINLYFCVNSKKKDLIEKLNNGIRNIKERNPNYNEQLYYSHFGVGNNSFMYTPSEKTALSNLKELIFYVHSDKPLDYNKAKDGSETGYYAYYIKDLARLLGKKYKIITVPNKVLQESKLPGFYLPMEHSDTENADSFLKKYPNYELKYLTNSTRVTEKKVCVNYGVTELTDKAVYASNSKLFCESMAKKGRKAVYVESYFEGLKLLSEHKVDAIAVDVMLTDYLNDLVKYKKITILKFTNPINEYMIGVNGINEDLFSAVNKTISLIPDKDSKMFMVKESGNHIYKPNLKEQIKNNSLALIGLGIIALIVILIFIEILIRKNNKIKELAKKAIEAKKAKNSFLSKSSHEMRTPLNAIISYANFGIEEKRDPNYVKYFQKIKFSADTLLVLMEDVLQLENKESKDILSEMVIVKNKSMKEKVESIIRPLAEAKNLKLEILFDSEVEYSKLDIKTVQQILINILTNAIKYTKSGGEIIWKVKTRKIGGNKIAVTHIISDNGVGISEEFQKHMFEPFTMENNELSKTEVGTGLGLSICQKNIEKLGGTISCASKLGKGSIFTIKFEILRASKDEIKEYEEKLNNSDKLEILELESEKNTLNKKLKILLCEDVEINARIVIKILTENAMEVDWVKNGKLGVQKAFENKYDAILMDIRMPIMDGLVAADLIRKKDKKVVIIALSANVYESDKLKSLAAGMNEHLGKPINKKELLKAIYHLVYEQNKVNKK